MIPSSELIPQRAPFVLVDNIVECADNRTVTEFSFDKSHILCKDGILLEAGLIENIAQSAAAGAGHHFVSQGLPVPIGFIGSVDKFKIHFLPKSGEKLITEVVILNKVMNVSIAGCKITVNGELCAECGMKIFIVE